LIFTQCLREQDSQSPVKRGSFVIMSCESW